MTARSSPPNFDLHRELEVDPDASPETIDAAWRSLADLGSASPARAE